MRQPQKVHATTRLKGARTVRWWPEEKRAKPPQHLSSEALEHFVELPLFLRLGLALLALLLALPLLAPLNGGLGLLEGAARRQGG